jgi:AbrB family looped-hinge helix DNA binding protein
METAIMPEVTIRPKGQITIPAEIMKSWHLRANDKVNVNLVNGVLMVTPTNRRENKKSILAYAGIARGLWGNTAEEIDTFIRNERDSWER